MMMFSMEPEGTAKAWCTNVTWSHAKATTKAAHQSAATILRGALGAPVRACRPWSMIPPSLCSVRA